jgi:ferric-dicitrate binding protein FerR (iron transport regulator)
MSELKSQQPSSSEPTPSADPDARPKRRKRGWLVALLVLLLVPLVACLGYWAFTRFAVDVAAQVDELSGLVHVQRKDELAWEPAELNQLVWGKDWIRTGDGSSARLRFFDVSTADIGPGAEIMVEELAKRRASDSGQVTLKMWSGQVVVRAVRLMDPSSVFRVDTPTASTVVRGARFTVEMEPDGETRVEVQQGSAEVEVEGETLTLGMGEQLTIGLDGEVTRQSVMEPNAELIQARIAEAWDTPGSVFQVELPEGELNQFLAAMGDQPGLPVVDPQIWLTGDEGRIYATLTEPIEFDLSAAFEIEVVDGRLEPEIRVGAGGLPVPVPGPVLDFALETALGQLQGSLDEAFQYVEFSDVQIKDGRILAVGNKQPDAPAP